MIVDIIIEKDADTLKEGEDPFKGRAYTYDSGPYENLNVGDIVTVDTYSGKRSGKVKKLNSKPGINKKTNKPYTVDELRKVVLDAPYSVYEEQERASGKTTYDMIEDVTQREIQLFLDYLNNEHMTYSEFYELWNNLTDKADFTKEYKLLTKERTNRYLDRDIYKYVFYSEAKEDLFMMYINIGKHEQKDVKVEAKAKVYPGTAEDYTRYSRLMETSKQSNFDSF